MGFDWKAIKEIETLRANGHRGQADQAELKMQAGQFAEVVARRLKSAIGQFDAGQMTDFETTVTIPREMGNSVAHDQIARWVEKADKLSVSVQDREWMLGNPVGKQLGHGQLVEQYRKTYGQTPDGTLLRIPASPRVKDVRQDAEGIKLYIQVPYELAKIAFEQRGAVKV